MTGGRIISGIARKEINIRGSTIEMISFTGTIGSINITSGMLKGSETVVLIIGIEAEPRKVIIRSMFIRINTGVRAYWRKRIELGIIIAEKAKFLLGMTRDNYINKRMELIAVIIILQTCICMYVFTIF